MATLRILNSKGDTAVLWKVEKLAAGDVEAAAAVKEAEKIFVEACQRGAIAFQIVGDETKKIEAFDSTVDADIVLVPRIAGG